MAASRRIQGQGHAPRHCARFGPRLQLRRRSGAPQTVTPADAPESLGTNHSRRPAEHTAWKGGCVASHARGQKGAASVQTRSAVLPSTHTSGSGPPLVATLGQGPNTVD